MKVAIILISESSLPIARTLSNEFLDSEIITTTLAPDCTYVSFYEEFMALSFHRYDALYFHRCHGHLRPHHRPACER